MYTLRIIEKKKGLEIRRNSILGKNYAVYSRTPLDVDEYFKEGESLFEKKLESFVGEEALKTMLNDNMVGFIENDKGAVTLFYQDQVVYIVTQDGKTLERVYGMYNKQ